MRDIDTIIIHCLDTYFDMNVGVPEVRQWHLDRGWSDIGYHRLITREGVVQFGRDIETAGAHAKGHNANSIGIALAGGRSKEGEPEFNFTWKQMAQLKGECTKLVNLYNIKNIIGHNQVSQKDCPCFNVTAWWNAGNFE